MNAHSKISGKTFAGVPVADEAIDVLDPAPIQALADAYQAAEAAKLSAHKGGQDTADLRLAEEDVARRLINAWNKWRGLEADDLDAMLQALRLAVIVHDASCIFEEDGGHLDRDYTEEDKRLRWFGRAAREEALNAVCATDITSAAELSRLTDCIHDLLFNGLGIDEEEAVKLLHDKAAELAQVQASSQSRKAWDEAVMRLEAAREVAAVAEKAFEVGCDELVSRAPCPTDLLDAAGDPAYTSVDQIRTDQRLTAERCIELMQLYNGWRKLRSDARTELGVEELQDADDEADSALSKAMRALLHTPAPDIAALTYKLHACNFRSEPTRTEQAEHLQALLTSLDFSDFGFALAYQDALRLNGDTSGLADIKAWDAAAWIDEFESHPGWELDWARPSPVFYPADQCRTWGLHPPVPEAKAMFAALKHWQKKAVEAAWRARPSREKLTDVIHCVRLDIDYKTRKGADAAAINREAVLIGVANEKGLDDSLIATARDNLDRHGWSSRDYMARHPDKAATIALSAGIKVPA